MKKNTGFNPPLLPLSRRRFMQGLAAGGLVASWPSVLQAGAANTALVAAQTGSAPVLTGPTIHLVVAETWVNFTGQARLATTINGCFPAPTLRLREGDEVTINVTNNLREHTSIHWHGIILPYQMDGVPGLSFSGIAPGSTFTYRFRLQQSGTYWYHSHSGMQELTGMFGAMIIEPREQHCQSADRDLIVQLSDWSDEDPMHIFHHLKKQSDYYNYQRPTAIDFFRDVSRSSLSEAIEKRRMWNAMRMNPSDLSDLSSATLSYLINGKTAQDNWTGVFKAGERLRLRFINSAGSTFYDVRIPDLKMCVVQADGVDIEPVTVDEFRFGPGQTYDVLVEPKNDAYTIFAQTMDRSGFARGTLSVRQGLSAAVPAPDAPDWLSMTDMMGAPHAGHDMSHGSMAGEHHHGTSHTIATPPSVRVRHARTEYGPSLDMRVDTPRRNLDDPGVGLRSNGRRVLTLADLHSRCGPLDCREPTREIELHLTGNMQRYTWSIDGIEFGKSDAIHMKHGERLRVILHNDTMMTHPMHLHGMWSELENSEGQFQARLHTLPVQPAQRLSLQLTANALGRWAWHCHLMLHMDAGMFREVVVS